MAEPEQPTGGEITREWRERLPERHAGRGLMAMCFQAAGLYPWAYDRWQHRLPLEDHWIFPRRIKAAGRVPSGC